MSQSSCPHCGCQRLHQSRSGNRRLLILRLFLVCVRCYGCCRKFYRLGPMLGGQTVPEAAEFGSSGWFASTEG